MTAVKAMKNMMIRICSAFALCVWLLMGCKANAADAQQRANDTANNPRYAGETAMVLLYGRTAKGDTAFLCSGAFVALGDPRVAQQGILTASHCFTEADPDTRAFLASFDDGKTFHTLRRAWMGDNLAGADIAFAEFDGSTTDNLRTYAPLPVAFDPAAPAAGAPLWTWGNPDNQGRALTLGYVMNPSYRKPPISGTLDGKEVMLDLRGCIVAELSIAPGSSGGMVIGEQGLVGVVSSDFTHENGFKTTFITPIARLKPLLSQPPKVIGSDR